MEDRVGKDDFQTAVGNVLAEFDTIRDEFRRSQISRDAYLQRVGTLRQTGRRFQMEFKQAHVVMAAPLK